MAKKNVIINYDYFMTKRIIEDDNNLAHFDLNNIFDEFSKKKPNQLIRNLGNGKATVENVVKDNDKWLLQFLKIREDYPPGIYDEESGDFKRVTLNDKEYIAESTSAIYDPALKVIMLQKNRHALNYASLEDYLQLFIKDDVVKLVVILQNNPEKKLKNKIIRALTISYTFPEDPKKTNPGIVKFIKRNNTLDGKLIKLRISVGRARSDHLNYKESMEVINQMIRDRYIYALQADYKETEYTKKEVINLLEDRLKDSDEYVIDRKNPVSHNNIVSKMMIHFTRRTPLIKKLI
jgi:hypothetical protein